MPRPYIVNANPVPALLTDAHALYSNWHSIFGIWSYARIMYRCSHGWLILLQFRSHYCVCIAEPTIEGGVHIGCAALSGRSMKHLNGKLSTMYSFYKCDNV